MRNSLILLLLFCSSFVYGQEYINLAGKIRFKKDNSPVPFGYIKLEGYAKGTVTDAAGNFKLRLEKEYANGALLFTYLGHKAVRRKIADLDDPMNILISLEETSTVLKEAVVTNKKNLNPIKILKSALGKIEDNYYTEAVNFDGYYREVVKENDAAIMFADADCRFKYGGYQNNNPKRKEKGSSGYNVNSTLSGFSYFGGSRLHRYHFDSKTLKEDQVKLIEARASDNLTKTRLYASTEGGPLGLLGKDRVKFKSYFVNNFGRYNYKVEETLEEDGKWYYLVSFDSEIDTTKLVKTRKSGLIIRLTKPDLMSGKIWIDEETEAITKISYSIPTHLKKFVCGYRDNNIRHFDYKVDLHYSLQGKKYAVDYIRLEDEFIFHDTITDNTIPYRAISELHVRNLSNEEVETFGKDEVFANRDSNRLFNYPLTYNGDFWKDYVAHVPEARIGEDIRQAMENEKSLERQFKEKVVRNEELPAPIAREKPYEYRHLGERIVDPYAWMKDTINPRSNDEVMDYLEAENKYADNYFNPLRGLQRSLFKEMMRRVDHDYTSLPTKSNGYEYHYRFLPNEEYPRWYRKKIGSDSVELILDVVKRAEGKSFYSASPAGTNPANNIMAYAENTDGSDVYTFKFLNLATQQDLADSISGIGGVVWKDSTHFFYLNLEKKTNRAYQIKFHELGTSFTSDPIIYEEQDAKFGVSIGKTKSKAFFVISTGSSTSSESYIMHSDDPSNQFQLVHPRTENMIYSLYHHKDKFYVMTNHKTPNFEVMVTDTAKYEMKHWKKFIAGKKGLMINSFLVFDNYFVVSEKKEALDLLRVIDAKTMKSYYIKTKWNLANFSISSNPDFDTDSLQYSYSSPATAGKIVKMHMGTKKERTVKKRVVNYFGSWGMKVERHWATASDGQKIPITLIYHKWNKKSRKRLIMKGYGAYGSSYTVGFDRNVMTLLNKGFTVAYAHVRGGADMGREWYEDGKMLNKKNSFTDFIACTEYLIEKGFTEKGEVTIEGGSAGGLLVGAVANMRPDLYKAVILNVPFVDVINTMLDDKLPLTTGEYEEWGNPGNKKYFDYIRTYSPYENVKAQDYPAMFFFTGLNDTRVSYWEPAKMVAKLRKTKTDDNPVLLKTDFFSGHGGSSGRFASLQELSYRYALIFELYSVKKEETTATP